jgi:hypothetical protein
MQDNEREPQSAPPESVFPDASHRHENGRRRIDCAAEASRAVRSTTKAVPAGPARDAVNGVGRAARPRESA